jgi:outer membrane immunogenic protein
MKRLLVAGAVMCALSAPALAAAMPVKAPIIPPSSWAGFYAGVGIGGRWLDPDWSTTAVFDPTGLQIPFQTDPNAGFDSAAFRVSGYAGYNWQLSPVWLVGFEGDLGWADNRDTLGSRIPGLGIVNGGSSTEVSANWDASIRARAGYLINPAWLAYITGGAAFQNVTATATCPGDTNVCNPATGTQSNSNSRTLTGWTIGGGLEGMLARNWLARIEYRYSDLGSFSFTALQFNPDAFGANAQLSVRSQTVTAGVAYKW